MLRSHQRQAGQGPDRCGFCPAVPTADITNRSTSVWLHEDKAFYSSLLCPQCPEKGLAHSRLTILFPAVPRWNLGVLLNMAFWEDCADQFHGHTRFAISTLHTPCSSSCPGPSPLIVHLASVRGVSVNFGQGVARGIGRKKEGKRGDSLSLTLGPHLLICKVLEDACSVPLTAPRGSTFTQGPRHRGQSTESRTQVCQGF